MLEFQIAEGIRLTDLIDVALVAVMLWALFSWLRRARARLAFGGVAIAAVAFLAARQLELQMTVWILQGFFAVLVVVLAVVFQEDLRRLFEQIAVWGLRRKPPAAPLDAVDAVVGAVRRLAAQRVGALIVIPGREPLDRHVTGGIPLGGLLSEPLLLSVFDPNSPGHDGAIAIEGEHVICFALHLPLSDDHEQLGAGGTRHAAALGLSERCDALCIVVSEERGTISIARDGQLRVLGGPELLAHEIRRLSSKPKRHVENGSRVREVLSRWPEAALAAVASTGMWLLLVPGSAVGEFQRSVPIVIENLPPGYAIESIEPTDVEVTFKGRRRDGYLARQQAKVSLHVDALLVQLGRRSFEVGPEDVQHPDGLAVVSVSPTRVKLNVVQSPAVSSRSPDR